MKAAPGPSVAVVGCDVVAVQRVAEMLARPEKFRTRVFTARELVDACRGGVSEGAVAAKEAARKALGDLSLGFHETEVRTDASGAPILYVRGKRSHLCVSLSHDGDVAFAVDAGHLACRSRFAPESDTREVRP